MTLITLAVHPWFGEEVVVIREWGAKRARRCVQIERPGHGDPFRIVPVAWTDLEPRPAPLILDGRPVLLGPGEALALAAWVEDRLAREDTES